jgi:hypothetical protein
MALASNLWVRNGPEPDVDPLGSHCFDVTVDTSDTKAMEWLNANEWQYTAKKGWKDGLCDKDVFPVVELVTHPPTSHEVTLRKSGHGAEVNATEVGTSFVTKDCRSDTKNKPLSIQFTNAAGVAVKIRGCQNGEECKPYVDCDLTFAAGASESVTFDDTFKYFIFEYKGKDAGKQAGLYPDANLHFPSDYTIKAPSQTFVEVGTDVWTVHHNDPGANPAHCTELSFAGGKNNPYWEAHGYQYQPPTWNEGNCDKEFNWFNRNTTIAPGVTQTVMGVHKN